MQLVTSICWLILFIGSTTLAWAQKPIESISKTYNFGIGQVNYTFNLQDAELKTPLNETGEVNIQSNGKSPINNQARTIAQGQLKTSLFVGYQHRLTFKVKGFEDTTVTVDLRQQVTGYNRQQTIALKPQMKEFKISLKDIETNENLNFGVVLTNKKRGQKIYLNSKDLRNGEYVVRIRVSDSYDLEVNNSESYAFYATKINHTEQAQQKKKLAIKLIPYKLGALIPLKNITFATKSAQLNANSFAELDRVTKLLKDHPTSRILIEAHTDSDGSYQRNLRLSQLRAQNVLKYLIQQGIQASRLETKGMGSAKPIAPNDTEANKARNRRFDIIVLKK
ncbi:hypothetical protein BKI52_33785 [marine bacterium AO1-C]|nr:hypothetical protein BKI52_33785 [marine bacterium AO1-C]